LILSTRIAETAVTIENVKVVIDIGYDKETYFDDQKRMNITENTVISKSNADQRAGRAGRTCPGVCYRIYSEEDYRQFADHKTAEIHRISLDHSILKLKKFNVGKILEFDFIERPSVEALRSSVSTLRFLGGLDEKENITHLGQIMAIMPTDPTVSAILIEGVKRGCEDEVAKIISVLLNSVNLYYYRSGNLDAANNSSINKFDFTDPRGDLLTFWKLFKEYEKRGKSGAKLKERANKYDLNLRALKEASNMLNDLEPIIVKLKDSLSQTKGFIKPGLGMGRNSDIEAEILKCFLKGYFMNLCYYSGNPNLGYTLLRHTQNIKIHLASSLYLQGALNHQWIIATDISKHRYLHTKVASFVDFNWIEEMIPQEHRKAFNLENLEMKPFYKRHLIPGISTAILLNFKNVSHSRIQALIDHKNVFFDANLESLTLEIWTTSPDIDQISTETNDIIEKYHESFKNTTIEKKYEGRTVGVIGIGAQTKELLLENESRSFIFTIPTYTDQPTYQSILRDFKIESYQFKMEMDSDKVLTCTATAISRKEAQRIEEYLTSEFYNCQFKYIPPSVRSTKPCLTSIKLTWFEGRSTGSGVIKYESAEDAKLACSRMNGHRIGETTLLCALAKSNKKFIKVVNIPFYYDEYQLEKLFREYGVNSKIIDTIINREDDPIDIVKGYKDDSEIKRILQQKIIEAVGSLDCIEEIKVFGRSPDSKKRKGLI